jgi:anaerobic magnesium-protoporphyrin IX monomethyl ester cyclase
MSRYSDATLEAVKEGRMHHDLLWSGIRLRLGTERDAKRHHDRGDAGDGPSHAQFGIIPEFSFVIGNPGDPERDTRETVSFIRKLKRINPTSEIIMQHYTPTPQPGKMYGDVEGQIAFQIALPGGPAKNGWTTRCASIPTPLAEDQDQEAHR